MPPHPPPQKRVGGWEGGVGVGASLEFAESQRVVENREKWRKLVAKSSVVLQRPSRLGDR